MRETLVTVTGNVISDLRSRRTADGTKIVSFRLASNERRYDRDSATWVDGDRLYVTVTCWRRLADGVAGSLTKGDPVIVTGRLHTRDYELDGQRRSSTELEAYAVGPDLGRCTSDVRRMPAASIPQARTPADDTSSHGDQRVQESDSPSKAESGDGADSAPGRLIGCAEDPARVQDSPERVEVGVG